MGQLVRAVLVVGSLTAACGAEPSLPSSPPADLFSALTGGPERALSSEELASDAFEPAQLAELLEQLALLGAVERTYSGGSAEIRRVEVRVVMFASPAGANRYLAWLSRNDEQLIGDNDPEAILKVPAGASVRIHEPGACCAKELPVALATWRSGSSVVVVTVSGPGVDGASAVEVVSEVHRALDGGGA